MVRNVIFLTIFCSFFSNISFAALESGNQTRKQFSQAQKLVAQGQIQQAIKAYQDLIKLNPSVPEAYNNLAALYLQQNKTKEAKHILEQGLKSHKGYGVLYESLTAINVAMARDAYSKALQIDLAPSSLSIASIPLSNEKIQQTENTIVITKNNNSLAKNKFKAEEKIILTSKPTDKIKSKQVIQDNNIQSVETTLQAWLAAWSAQAIDMYLSFYHNKYRPANGMSHKGWVQSRRYRLKKPRWIKVSLSELDIKKQGKTQAVVNFKQTYKSNSFSDVSYKQVVLINTDDGWRIFREKNL